MTETEHPQTSRSPEEIRAWLAERVAYYSDSPVEKVDPNTPLVDYGIDSVYVFALCGEIEDKLSLRVEPSLLWDVETVAELADRLVTLTAK